MEEEERNKPTWAELVSGESFRPTPVQPELLVNEEEEPTDPVIGSLILLRGLVENMKTEVAELRGSKKADFQKARTLLDRLRMARHEYYASLFRAANNLDQAGTDVEHLSFVKNRLHQLGLSDVEINILDAKARSTEFIGTLKLTPDTVEVEHDEEGPRVKILDYSVSVHPVKMLENKLEKYGSLLRLYEDFKPTLTIAILHPGNLTQIVKTFGVDCANWNEVVLTEEAKETFQMTLSVTASLIEGVTPEDKERVLAYLNSSSLSPERVVHDVEFNFAITPSEFFGVNQEWINTNEFLSTLNEDERKMWFAGILYTSRGNKGMVKMKEELKKLNITVPGKEEWMSQLEAERKDVIQQIMTNHAKDYPTPPTTEKMDSALKDHQARSREVFEKTERARLIAHIPFFFRCKKDSISRTHAIEKLADSWMSSDSRNDDYVKAMMESATIIDERGKILCRDKHQISVDELAKRVQELDVEEAEPGDERIQLRTRALYKALMDVADPDDTIFFLRDLTMSGSLNNEECRILAEGKAKLSMDRSTGELILTKRERPTNNIMTAIHEMPDIPSSEEHSVFLLSNEEFEARKDTHTICMKKGRVLIVRPMSTRQQVKFKELAGVGFKEKKKWQFKKGEKVKSLDFSSESLRNTMSKDFVESCKRLASCATKVGQEINPGEEDLSIRSLGRLEEECRERARTVMEKIQVRAASWSSSGSSSEEMDAPRAIHWALPKERRDDITEYFRSQSIITRGKFQKNEFEKGIHHFARSHQVLYENLSYVNQMASSGYRVCHGNNPGQTIVTFPTESIMKGDTAVPFIVITVCLPGDIYEDVEDSLTRAYPMQCGGKVYVTMGRRVNRAQLMGHTDTFSKFQVARSILDHLRSESGGTGMDPMEQCALYLYINCVNINSSSMLDNVRYMVELCMADRSFVEEYIRDKLMVPVKTKLHMYLYTRMLEMLTRLNESMRSIRMRKPNIDEDGNVDISSMRVVDGSFESFLFSNTYRKPDHLLQEVITLYFCTQKALHGKHHNALAINKTPLEIQESLNKIPENDYTKDAVTARHQYSPRMMRIASMAAETSCSASPDQVRMSYQIFEAPDDNPLSIPTLSSTRSTLIDVTEELRKRHDTSREGLDNNINFSELSGEDRELTLESLTQAASRVSAANLTPGKRSKIWRRARRQIFKKLGPDSTAAKYIKENLILNADNGRIYQRPRMSKDKTRAELASLIRDQRDAEVNGSTSLLEQSMGKFGEEATNNYRFYDSGVVLTEMIQVVESRNWCDTSVSRLGKEFALSQETTKFAVRPKGQRTQKDREIFVLDLNSKIGLYLVEHFFKQMCSKIQSEKISMPGDLKIIDMNKQAKGEISWCKSMLEALASESGHEGEENVHCLHFNMDMTKWAPKDNLQKFYWTIAYSKYLTIGEKLFMVKILEKLWNKEMYIDDSLILNSMKTTRDHDVPPEECIFFRMTDGFKRNMVKVKQTWLQGQLNYLSSFVHAGAMRVFEECVRERWGSSKTMINSNVHSDDNETTVCVVTKDGMEAVIRECWDYLDFITKNVCIEISKKKSSVSKLMKNFISIYNIGGEQVHPWVKPLMTTISGLPYLTLADDISSAVSKVAEAGSKGAPKSSLQTCLDVARRHILDIHGVLDRKTGENKFAKALEVDEKLLPTTLGGMHVFDMSSLILCGPKVIDKAIILQVLRSLTGARSDRRPERGPNDAEATRKATVEGIGIRRSVLKRALSLLVVTDMICYDPVDSEEQVSLCKGLNFFRPTKFLHRRTGSKVPFKGMDSKTMITTAESIKEHMPGISIRKPKEKTDLRNYLICQYSDSKFQDSLAGQSPAVLKLGLIQQRHKASFRLLKTGSVQSCGRTQGEDPEAEEEETDETIADIEAKIEEGLPLNLQEVTKYLLDRMDQVRPSKSDCEMLWSRFISNDPEFKCVFFVLENHTTGLSYRKPNLIPVRKPNFDQYSDMANSINDILLHLLDDDYEHRNGFKLKFPRLLDRDYEVLEGMFPREAMLIRYRACLMPGKMKNFQKMMKDKDRRKETPTAVQMVRDRNKKELDSMKEGSVARRKKKEEMESQLERELEELFRWHDVDLGDQHDNAESVAIILRERKCRMPTWVIFTNEQIEYCKKNLNQLYKDIMRMSRSFKASTGRVLFTPPMTGNEITDLTLQLRSSVESTRSYQLVMHMTKRLGSSKTLQLLSTDSSAVEWAKHAVDAISLVFEVARILGSDAETLNMLIEQSTYSGKAYSEILKIFTKLPRMTMARCIVPLGMCYPEYTPVMIQALGPYTKHWIEPQEEYGVGRFSCLITGSGFILNTEGVNKKLTRINIRGNANRLPLAAINEALQDLAKDVLHGAKRYGQPEVALSKVLNIEEQTWGSTMRSLALDTLQNRIVDPRGRRGLVWVRGLVVTDEGDSLRERTITCTGPNANMSSLRYQEELMQAEVAHKFTTDCELQPLEIPDIIVNNLSLTRVVNSPMLQYIATRRMRDVQLEEMIRSMESPGQYTATVGSMQSRYAVKLLVGTTNDAWLESRWHGHLSELGTDYMFDHVADHVEKVAESQYNKMYMADEVELLEDQIALLKETKLMEIETKPGRALDMLAESKYKRELEQLNRRKEHAEKEARAAIPKRPFPVPEEILDRTEKMMLRLLYRDEMENARDSSKIQRIDDLFVGRVYTEDTDFSVMEQSPADVLVRITEDIKRKIKDRQRFTRRTRPPMSKSQLLGDCDMTPLDDVTNTCVARCLALMTHYYKSNPAMYWTFLNEAYKSVMNSKHPKLLVESLLAGCNVNTYYALPPIAKEGLGEGHTGFKETEQVCYNNLQMTMKSPENPRNKALNCLNVVVMQVRVAVKQAAPRCLADLDPVMRRMKMAGGRRGNRLMTSRSQVMARQTINANVAMSELSAVKKMKRAQEEARLAGRGLEDQLEAALSDPRWTDVSTSEADDSDSGLKPSIIRLGKELGPSYLQVRQGGTTRLMPESGSLASISETTEPHATVDQDGVSRMIMNIDLDDIQEDSGDDFEGFEF
uniref:RNA-directed RNA polymerase L n=1 Tax=Ubmeje virus TaxID=2739780 RepID=A0A859D5D2_9VIRU|nr:RNA-dependent RNA polymerase [Ubmeje virus]